MHELLTRGGHHRSLVLLSSRNGVYVRAGPGSRAVHELPLAPHHGAHELMRANLAPQQLPHAPRHPTAQELAADLAAANLHRPRLIFTFRGQGQGWGRLDLLYTYYIHYFVCLRPFEEYKPYPRGGHAVSHYQKP